MPVIARRMGSAVSDGAKMRAAGLKAWPTLDTWRNPLTRGIARRFAHDAWTKTLKELDFEFRLSDTDVAGVSCVRYETAGASASGPLILNMHGGHFVSGSARTHAAIALPLCRLAGAEGLGINYTLLPEAFFPTQIEELDRVYKALVNAETGRNIVLIGDGVGAALMLSAMMGWRDEGVRAPAGAIFISPCVDGAGASDTHIALDSHDPVIRSGGGKFFRQLFRYYAPDRALKDPAVSPLYGAFEWLPPMMIHAGAREVLLGDAARLAETARRAGVEAVLRVFDGMFHGFHMHWSLDEARAAHADLADFLARL